MSEKGPGYVVEAAEARARAKLAAMRSRLTLTSDDCQRHQYLAAACEREAAETLAAIQKIKQDFPELANEPLITPALSIEQLINAGLLAGAAHHKQWYIEQIALALGIEPGEHEAGIAP